MAHLRGFKLRRGVGAFCCRLFRLRIHRSPHGLLREDTAYDRTPSSSAISRLRNWCRRLKTAVCSAPTRGGYLPLGGGGEAEPDLAPKGHLAVYVGQKGGDFQRIVVPVMYFNHPLFGGLLKAAEAEYGFHHPGGITIPCRISEFENVHSRISAVHGCRKLGRLRHAPGRRHYW